MKKTLYKRARLEAGMEREDAYGRYVIIGPPGTGLYKQAGGDALVQAALADSLTAVEMSGAAWRASRR